MEHVSSTTLVDARPAAARLGAADYVRLLHPPGAKGHPSLVIKKSGGEVRSARRDLEDAPDWAECLLDDDAYVSLHRFYGRRRGNSLAALNGYFLDLDVARVSPALAADRNRWRRQVEAELARLGLPQPSVLLFTGRGLAAIWLITPMPAKARSRWKAVQGALIELFRRFGADPSCRDVARVTRLPGSLNSKSGLRAGVLGGSLCRYASDRFADLVFVAAGRPTRSDLRAKQEKKRKPSGSDHRPRGLPPTARFRAVARDLERLRDSWGGEIPEGLRNIWLHLYATALSHTRDATDIAQSVRETAADATPGLPESEVEAIAKGAVERGTSPRSNAPYGDGRYHYAGATIAERLDVTADQAHDLGLEQILPKSERARRKALKERERRAARGAMTRAEWLAANNLNRRQPWKAAGISRATWFRRKKAADLAAKAEPRAEARETRACPPQGGEARVGHQPEPARAGTPLPCPAAPAALHRASGVDPCTRGRPAPDDRTHGPGSRPETALGKPARPRTARPAIAADLGGTWSRKEPRWAVAGWARRPESTDGPSRAMSGGMGRGPPATRGSGRSIG